VAAAAPRKKRRRPNRNDEQNPRHSSVLGRFYIYVQCIGSKMSTNFGRVHARWAGGRNFRSRAQPRTPETARSARLTPPGPVSFRTFRPFFNVFDRLIGLPV
jgi:hypothetical protein